MLTSTQNADRIDQAPDLENNRKLFACIQETCPKEPLKTERVRVGRMILDLTFYQSTGARQGIALRDQRIAVVGVSEPNNVRELSLEREHLLSEQAIPPPDMNAFPEVILKRRALIEKELLAPKQAIFWPEVYILILEDGRLIREYQQERKREFGHYRELHDDTVPDQKIIDALTARLQEKGEL